MGLCPIGFYQQVKTQLKTKFLIKFVAWQQRYWFLSLPCGYGQRPIGKNSIKKVVFNKVCFSKTNVLVQSLCLYLYLVGTDKGPFSLGENLTTNFVSSLGNTKGVLRKVEPLLRTKFVIQHSTNQGSQTIQNKLCLFSLLRLFAILAYWFLPISKNNGQGLFQRNKPYQQVFSQRKLDY